jgi:hypothetical protein
MLRRHCVEDDHLGLRRNPKMHRRWLPRALRFVFAQDQLKLLAHLVIAAVVNSIGVKDKDVPRTHQCYFSDIGRVQLPRAKLHRVVLFSIWVICRDLQAERQELHHSAFIYVHEFAALGTKH